MARGAFVPTAAWWSGASLCWRSGFDATMRVGEDVDLVWRLTMAGWTVRYEPACRVHHEHRKRLGPLLARRAAYGYSAGALSRRHPGKVVPVQLSAWSALAWGLAAAGAPVGWRCGGARRAWPGRRVSTIRREAAGWRPW